MAEKNRDYVTVQELSEGFSEYWLPQLDDFVGKQVTLYYENGRKAVYEFLDRDTFKCTCGETVFAAIYTLVSPRPGIYFFDYIKSFGDTKSATTILDLNRGIATSAVAILPSKEEVAISQFERGDKKLPLTSITMNFMAASINKPFTPDTPKHQFTTDLVGKRMQFIYSSNDVYEHIYLNDKFYTWHCLKGIEKGLCDTDRCFYLKLAEGLYWFMWMERVVPTVGSVVEDFAAMRSYGKLFGYESYEMTTVTNFPAGSYAKLLNETEYDFE